MPHALLLTVAIVPLRFDSIHNLSLKMIDFLVRTVIGSSVGGMDGAGARGARETQRAQRRCGGRSGRLTPDWWPALSTQFGFLKTWRVTREGSYLENQRIGDTTIDDLAIGSRKYISVTIEVAPDAKNAGGINLFGERFGDHPQSLMLCLGYHMRQDELKDSNNL